MEYSLGAGCFVIRLGETTDEGFHFASRLANSVVSFGLFPDFLRATAATPEHVWGWARIVRRSTHDGTYQAS